MFEPKALQNILVSAGYGQKGNSKSFVLTCPRCGKKDKLYIRKRDGRFVCFVCKERDNFQGRCEYALTEITGQPIPELRRMLYGEESVTASVVLDLQLSDFGEEEVFMPETLQEVDEHPDFRDLESEWGARGLKYLESRGIPLSIAKEYGITFWPAQSRVVFPVKSQGKWLGWQSRTINPDKFLNEDGELIQIAKALTYGGLKKDKTLGFSDRITGDHAVLCEGPVDAIKCHLIGGNVCSFGKAVSKYQLNLLRYSGIKKLYLGLDLDAAPEIQRIVRELAGEIELYDMRPPPGLDLGGMTFEAVHELYLKAPRVTPATLFLYLKEVQ